MKKLVSILLSLVLVLSVACAYAGGEEYGEHLDISVMGNAISKKLPEDNAYVIEKVNEKFNVTIHSVQVVNNIADQVTPLYADSNNIPDAMLIASAFIDTVLDQELVREIPLSVMKEYSPKLLEQIEINYPNFRKTAIYNAENDSLYAFPSGQGEFYPLYGIRADWMEKVGATMPTNLDEFKELCRKFTEEDPDGNGVNDTWGLAIGADYFKEVAPLAAAFGITLPEGSANNNDSWYVSDDQTYAYKAQISPEFKALTAYLADMYKLGYIYPDLAAAEADCNVLFYEGKVGIHEMQTIEMMSLYQPEGTVATLYKLNPDARLEMCPPFEGSIFEKQTSPWRYHGFGWDCSDEKMIRVLQIYEESLKDDVFNAMLWRGEEGTHFTYVNGMAQLTPEYAAADAQVSAALKWMFVNFRTDEQKLLTFGPQYYELLPYQAMCNVQNELIPAGVAHPVMDEYAADLKTLEKQMFWGCISGQKNIETDWDAYVAEWNSRGGKASCEEALEVWKSLQ